jgi:hypothetical protein
MSARVICFVSYLAGDKETIYAKAYIVKGYFQKGASVSTLLGHRQGIKLPKGLAFGTSILFRHPS